MSIPYSNANGNLPPGRHTTAWPEVADKLGTTARRQILLMGLRHALLDLQAEGCQTVYVDGSFVTNKPKPVDFDACWDITGVDPARLDPVQLTFENGRAAQKACYHGALATAGRRRKRCIALAAAG